MKKIPRIKKLLGSHQKALRKQFLIFEILHKPKSLENHLYQYDQDPLDPEKRHFDKKAIGFSCPKECG